MRPASLRCHVPGGLSHDTAGSLVVRYFDCVALPHTGGAALPRFRMKRPPGTKRGGPDSVVMRPGLARPSPC